MRHIVILALLVLGVSSKGLKEEFTWTRLNYEYPSHIRAAESNKAPGPAITKPGYGGSRTTTRSPAASPIPQDLYTYENNIPMGANRWQDKLFITVPRRRLGVPSTLNFVWMNSTERHNVPLIPYPNWEINQGQTQGGEFLTSVYRTGVDACDRLWMVDTGRIEIPNNATQVKEPEIIIIDLHTDKIIKRHTLNPNSARPTSTLASIFIDVKPDECDNAFAYIPDLSAFGIVVYSLKQDDSWRVSHNYFFLEPSAGEFHIAGIDFQWNDGVFSLGLSDADRDGFRTVYFHSMAGTSLYHVSTRVLKDRTLATRSFHQDDFKVVLNRGEGAQTSASDLHRPSGVLFLALVNRNALGCWNTNKPAALENFDIVHKDDSTMIYPSDVKVYKDEVIVMTNRMPIFLYRTLNYDDTNFRVFITNVDEATKGTACTR